MEPMDDKELTQLLRKWEAPSAPSTLTRRVLGPREPWWRWLLTGQVRIPVPVGVAIVMALGFWVYSAAFSRPPATSPSAPTVSLADFQPVQKLEPVVLGERK